MKAKRSAARRRNHEARLREMRAPVAAQSPDHAATKSPTWDDVQTAPDEELQALPEHYRAALVLCVLEGKSVPEAAAQLECKLGTVSSWLTRARQRLQQRLARRGIKLATLLLAVSVAESSCQAAVPTTLVHATIRFGLWVAAGEPVAGVIPSHVAALATGVTRAMFLTKAKIATALLLAVGVVTGAGALMHQVLAAQVDAPQGTGQKQWDQTSKPLATAEKTAKPQEPAPKKERPETVRFSGRVLDPDGKPVLGAKLLF